MFLYSALKLSDDFTNYVDEAGKPIEKLDKMSKVNISLSARIIAERADSSGCYR